MTVRVRLAIATGLIVLIVIFVFELSFYADLMAGDDNAAAFTLISRHALRAIVLGALAAGLAGIAGTVLVTYFPTSPSVGFSLMPIIIIATTIGGLGSIGGTFLGGIFCGVIQQVTAMMWNSALQDVPLYVLLLLFIAFRPTGFFGVRSE